MTTKTETIKGVFNRILWRSTKDENDPCPYLIASLISKTTIVGNAIPEELISGVEYEFQGQWETHKKYGKQFKFHLYKKLEPHSRYGLVKYLSKYAPGIGAGIAARLYDEFGNDAAKVLRTDPKRAAEACKHLTVEKAKKAAAALKIECELEDTKIELEGLLGGEGFQRKAFALILKKWGIHAPNVIRRDPFKLLVNNLPSAGFRRCDKLYLKLGLPPDRIKRQLLCVWNALQNDSSGDTWHTLQKAESELKKSVSGTSVNFRRAVMLGIRAGWLTIRKDDNGTPWIAEAKKAHNEQRLAEKIQELLNPGDGRKPKWAGTTEIEASDHQVDQAMEATSGFLGILAGTPGTGKTYTTAAIIVGAKCFNPYLSIAVAAPTGKAAVRCTEAMQANGLNIEAKTIHRMLGVTRNGYDGGGWGFKHNAGDPLPYDFIVVDEVSMLDVDTAAALFDAIAPGTHVLLVGDKFQLPPVGHGAPLRDMINAGVPIGELTEIHRNEGGIVTACKEIKDNGQYVVSSPIVIIGQGHNLKHWETKNPAQTLQVLEQRLLKHAAAADVDPVWDVQILVSLNGSKTGKNDLSRAKLNPRLQAILNPDGEQVKGDPFRVNDKVICTSNTWLPLVDENGEQQFEDPDEQEEGDPFDHRSDDKKKQPVEEFVANGEIGRVVAVEGNSMRVYFASPERFVKVFMGKPKGGSGGHGNDSKGCKFDLAYAITCHKAQGSQARIIITLADFSRASDMVASREWWYTALSRAETLCLTIGMKANITRQCKRVGLKDRKTFLVEQLTQQIPQEKEVTCT